MICPKRIMKPQYISLYSLELEYSNKGMMQNALSLTKHKYMLMKFDYT